MAQGSFSAGVTAWVAETRERMAAVRQEAAQRTVEIMQTPVAKGGNLPLDTGFMRASLQAQIGQGAFTARDNPGGDGSFSYDAGAVSLVIAKAKPSDPITLCYTANYAIHQEYGARGRPGRAFVRLAAQQWQRVISDVSAEAQARAKGR